MGPSKKAKIFRDCQVSIQTETLSDVTEFGAHDVTLPPNVGAGNGGGAPRWPGQPTQHAHRGRLPRPIGADETEDGPGINVERKITHGIETTVALAQGV